MIKDHRIFITGGLGFVGTNLCARLLEHNQVTVFDSGWRRALDFAPWSRHPNLEVVTGDILDLDHLRRVVPGHSMVIHLAAIAGVDTVISRPFTTLQVNLIGTYNLVQAIDGQELTRFACFSTSEVYGPSVFRADEEGMSTLGPNSQPRWQYALSKLASEFITLAYHREHGLPAVVVRPFNVYGPYQVGEGAVRNFVFRALRGQELIVHGRGEEIRSWCYIDDFIDGLLACLESDQAVGQTFNLGNPQATSTNLALAEEVLRVTGSESQIVFKEIAYPEIELRVPSIEKARQVFGYQPRVNLRQGLEKYVAWCRKHPEVWQEEA